MNTFAEYAIDFGNQIHVSSMNGYNIRSSAFKVADIPDDVYLFDIPNFDRKTGTVSFFCLQSPGSNTSVVKRKNICKIDYVKGRITLNPVNIISGKLKNGQQIM